MNYLSIYECGTTAIQDSLIQPFIINGRDTTIEEWPWYGVLRVNGTFLCGASLIDSNWAITASHCIRSYSFYVVYTVSFGINSRNSDDKWHQEIEVEEIIGNDYISSPWLINDITLLRLKYPAQINNFTRPVCLPTPASLQTIRTQGPLAECFVIGQGTTDKVFADPTSGDILSDVLQQKQVLILSKDYCKESWTYNLIDQYKELFPENVVCVGTEAPSSPLCFGDSGGPLVCKADSGRWELFGIVSFGYGTCYHDLIPSVLTSVADYRGWIKDVTGLKLGGQ
ncbi:CUB and peptidase domain-containing protein 2-like [Ruditapes philippinarum]|uniref:CUB and peptidase domain-containing protein 2-like n=1 Tax=Ruditapes philippinarum TaxID=129788 RepID=UPI00295AB76F|nr:CUB and peptidase domain-containing protein 2-like [Ruditapes philippinarum]